MLVSCVGVNLSQFTFKGRFQSFVVTARASCRSCDECVLEFQDVRSLKKVKVKFNTAAANKAGLAHWQQIILKENS